MKREAEQRTKFSKSSTRRSSFQRQECRAVFNERFTVPGMVCRSTETCYSAIVFACFFLPPQPSGPSTVNNRHAPSPWHSRCRPRAVPPTCKAPPLISRSVQIYYCIDPIPFPPPTFLLLFPSILVLHFSRFRETTNVRRVC